MTGRLQAIKKCSIKHEHFQMIVPSMTKWEIALHLLTEITRNQKRVFPKIRSVAKRIARTGRKVYAYQQTIGSSTRLTIYIYRINKKSVGFVIGCWYHSVKGLCWASVGENEVNFYIAHFFHRYAERFLKKEISVFDSAMEFYRQYQVNPICRIKKRDDGLYEIQTPLQGGLGLGIHDVSNGIVIYNTFVTEEMLRADQVKNIEDDRELNEAIQTLGWLKHRVVSHSIKI
jgi:hypothetical protein